MELLPAATPKPEAVPGDTSRGDDYVILADGPADIVEERRQASSGSSSFLSKIERRRKLNVTVTMYYTVFGTLVFSIIQWTIFDTYVSFLSKSLGMQYVNSSVGFAESIAGMTSLVLAIPVGLIVDNCSRTKALKVAAVLGIIASMISFYAFAYDQIIPLYCNLFLWGVYSQVSGSASEAIFADSIATGRRLSLFAKKGILERFALSLGPAIMVVLFYYSGDEWTLSQLHLPLLLGCIAAPIPCVILWFYRNPHPEVGYTHPPASPLPSAPSAPSKLLAASPMTVRERLTSASPSVTFPRDDDMYVEDTCNDDHDVKELGRFNDMTWQEKSIPYLVAFSDFVRKIGAGMTVKFFPLFFINDYGFKPIHVNMLFCAYPLSIGFATMSLQGVAQRTGRAQAALIFQLLGILFLLGMCYLKNMWLMVIFFMLRGSFQNAGYPLDKSIIMDYVPSKRRGLWNAVESITSMTWSGSAVLGGVLADIHDYRYTFLITAIIYLVAAIFYAPLLWVVPKREVDAAAVRRQRAARTKVVPSRPMSDQDHRDDRPMMLLCGSDSKMSFILEERETSLDDKSE